MTKHNKASLRTALGPQAYHLLELCGYRQIRRPLVNARTKMDGLAKSFLSRTPLRRAMLCDIQNITDIYATHPDITDYQVMSPAQEIQFDTPSEREFLQQSDCFSDAAYRQPEHFVCSVKNACINFHHGAVATSDGILLAESAMEWRRMSINGAYRSRRVTPQLKMDGEFSTIWGMWGQQFYHWWIDCLPRYASLQMTSPVCDLPLILPKPLSPFQQQSMEAVLPKDAKIVFVEHDQWFRVDSLRLPSFVTWKACGFLPPEHANYMREACFDYADVDQTAAKNKRLYLSRSNIKRRQVLNEDELISRLKPMRFEVCRPESMTLADQIRLFQSAECIVAPHGSALVNLLFSNDAKVLELFPTQTPQTHFFFLCKSLGHKYRFLLHHESNEHANFAVDLDAFESELDQLMNF